MINIKYYKDIYDKIKPEILKRFEDFAKINQNASEEEIFRELCFCLCTPQTKAVNADKAIKKLTQKDLLLKGKKEEIAECLKGLVRFHNNKSKYILEARSKFSENNNGKISIKKHFFNKHNKEARLFFYENVNGLGLKESSHFLRNIGFGENIAILDRHILKNLKILSVIDEIPKILTKNIYFEIEKKLENFAQKIGIEMHHLDFVFWYNEAGKVFK